MASRDILKTLQAEHDEIRALFEAMEATTDRAVKKRGALLVKIKAGLLPHAKWEEQVFYPAFAERADRAGLKTHAEAIEEHRAVEKTVLPDVHAADFGTPQFAGRVKVLGEMIDHHATEEESTMFKMARKMFSAAERAQLDLDYADWKASPAAATAVAAAEMETGLKAVARKITRRT
ncbi:MAG: hemerythrin domain-containing protein [Lysobacteraceae bacterium]|nr:MAG: hemerythrin domain-containing protein [Xanthomonadaceae bacterium]